MPFVLEKAPEQTEKPNIVESEPYTFLGVIYLGVWIVVVLAIIINLVRKFIKKRKETEEERKIREQRETKEYRKQKKTQERISRLFGELIYLAGFLLILTGVSVFFYQCYFWLKSEIWLEMPLRKILAIDEIPFDNLKTDWKGIQKIVLWLIEQSSALAITIIGYVTTVIGALMKN